MLDEDPLSHERLDAGQTKSWEDAGGQFTVGTALETDALIQAGIERADVFIASTDGDNTNLVIAQIAQRRFGVEKVIVRVWTRRGPTGTASRACTRSARPSTRSRCSNARSSAGGRGARCTRSSPAPARWGGTSPAS